MIVLDEARPQNSSVSVIIQTASIDTNHEKRDEHLRGADFLDVETHPTIIFSSSRIEKIGARTARVFGELTIMGATRPVTLFMTLNAVKPHPLPQYNGVVVAGFSGRTTIKRSDFGMTYGLPAIADDIEVILEIEAHKTGGAPARSASVSSSKSITVRARACRPARPRLDPYTSGLSSTPWTRRTSVVSPFEFGDPAPNGLPGRRIVCRDSRSMRAMSALNLPNATETASDPRPGSRPAQRLLFLHPGRERARRDAAGARAFAKRSLVPQRWVSDVGGPQGRELAIDLQVEGLTPEVVDSAWPAACAVCTTSIACRPPKLTA